MDSPFLGQIQAFGFNFAPRGWALCQGQLMSISQNTALFSLLGTTYGGDGTTTFALPDLRGRVAVGQGQGPGLTNVVMGEQAGATQITLTTAQMPAHTHIATAAPHTHTSTATSTLFGEALIGTFGGPAGKLLAASAANQYILPDPQQNVAFAADAITTTVVIDAATVAVTNGAAGSSLPVGIQTPYLGVNMSIATQGLFPSRN